MAFRFRPVFTERQAEQLTGLSRQTLGRWRRFGLFEPTFDLRGVGGPLSWIYNYADVLMLRTLATLRREHGLGLDALGPVARWFVAIDEADEERGEAWRRRLWVVDGQVLFEAPTTDAADRAAVIDLTAISNEIDREWDVMRRRDPATIGRVSRNRYVMHNAWVVAGTRIPTELIRHFAEDGYDEVAILREYPDLTPADIQAALEHERALLARAA